MQRRRRRHSSAWRDTPRWVKVSAAGCLLFLLVLFAVLKQKKPSEPAVKIEAKKVGEAFDRVISRSPQQLDLVLSKAALNSATRRIEAVVTNTSDRPYADVEVVFFLSAATLEADGRTTGVISPKLAPHESMQIATDPIEGKVREWAVKTITGTPR